MNFGFGQPVNGIIQTAFIVADIDDEIRKWSRDLAAGPWYVIDNFAGVDPVYRGKPALGKIKAAMGFAGHMQIELIQPLDDHPSVYRETRDIKGFGFHHFGLASIDVEADKLRFEQLGYELAYETGVPTGDVVSYYDTKGKLPGFIEIIPSSHAVDQLFTAMYAEAVKWDGQEITR